MRWRGQRKSKNVEDRRSESGPALGGLGGRGGMLNLLPMVFKVLGFKGGLIAVLALGAYALFSGNLGNMLGTVSNQQTEINQPANQSPAEKELVSFVSVVLADTETTWHTLFKDMGGHYKEPRLVLFRNSVQSACGTGQAAMGPFYCPSDQKVYIDLSFYNDLKNRFKAPGDFAQAYVIAHEVGHHVQTLLGISQKVQDAKQTLGKVQANQLSVRQELQADCFAGVWAFHADQSRQLLEQGDVEEALTAASAIGDDRLQKQSQGHVTPDSFTHGSSAQRVHWFKMGQGSGDIKACDTFAADSF